MQTPPSTSRDIESPYAWARLCASLVLMTIGGSGIYTISVVLPRIQAEFGVTRADASLPYTLSMIGFGFGGILMGRLADRFGVMVPVLLGAVFLSAGFIAAGAAGSLWQFALAQGVLMGLFGSGATFAPLAADTTQWFTRRRGIAVAICMSGNYLAGAVWAPIVQHFVESAGWRQTYTGMGVFCLFAMLPLALVLRRRPPATAPLPASSVSAVALPNEARNKGALPPRTPPTSEGTSSSSSQDRALVQRFPNELPSGSDPSRPLGMSPGALQGLLCVAGVACCVAMSMPQVHIVAYCTDLGFGAARGAQMLAVMLAAGIVSRLVSGWISDYIGGLKTLMLGSILQGIALLMFLFTDGVGSLFVVAAMFGLFQGGIVPSYALIVRQYFTPREAGARVGTVLMASLFGMALGGWMCGAVFDLTGSYRAAFLNGTAWNLLNVGIVAFLLYRARRTGLTQGLERRHGEGTAPVAATSPHPSQTH